MIDAPLAASARDAAAPPGLRGNPALRRHGVNGFLLYRLGRYALLGWCCFLVSLTAFFLYALIDALRPAPVLAVDPSGRVLGHFEYLSADARSDAEIIAAARYFAERYLSLNSHSIYDDYAAAMTMMDAAQRAKTTEELRETNYLNKVRRADTRSYLEYLAAPTLVSRDGDRALVSLSGRMIIYSRAELSTERRFDLLLDLRVVPRNSWATIGMQVVDMRQAEHAR